MDNTKDKYIINQNYHGDVKYITMNMPKVNTPTDIRGKVSLIKPTDNNIKPIVNLYITPKQVHNDKSVCLTKPNDIERTIPVIKPNINSIAGNVINTKPKIQVSHMVRKTLFSSNVTLSIIIAILIFILVLLYEFV